MPGLPRHGGGDRDRALRYLKLRHSRQAWHLANLLLHCAARATAPDASHDAWLAERLGLPPLVKPTHALDSLGHARDGAEAWRFHDVFLQSVSRREVRDELGALRPRDEAASATFAELKANAARYDHAADAIVQRLLDDPRTREHLVRFGLLWSMPRARASLGAVARTWALRPGAPPRGLLGTYTRVGRDPHDEAVARQRRGGARERNRFAAAEGDALRRVLQPSARVGAVIRVQAPLLAASTRTHRSLARCPLAESTP